MATKPHSTAELPLLLVSAGTQGPSIRALLEGSPGLNINVAAGDAELALNGCRADLVVIAAAPSEPAARILRHRLTLAAAFGVRQAIVTYSEPEGRPGRAEAQGLEAFARRLGYLTFAIHPVAAVAAAARGLPPRAQPMRLVPAAEAPGRYRPTTTALPRTEVVLMPSARPSSLAVVEDSGAASGLVAVTLADGARLGNDTLIAAAGDRPEVADQAAANLFWIGATPLLPARPYALRTPCTSGMATVTQLRHRLNTDNLDEMAARRLSAGELGQVNLSFSEPLVFDRIDHCPPTARFSLHETADGPPVGVGAFRFALRRATNIHWQALSVDKPARAAIKGQRPACLWLTGLSGAGKSTIASLVEKRLVADGRHTYTLDGDNVRHGLNRDLGFTDADRVENIRRVGEVARLMVDAGLIVIVSFISPFRAERAMARGLFASGEFIEVFVDAPLAVCEGRDPKGLYKKARAGQLKNFTGIDSAYEAPDAPEIHLAAGRERPEALAEAVLAELHRRGLLGSS